MLKGRQNKATDRGRFDMRALRRLTLWGMAAAGAVALVVLVGQSETGSRRIMASWGQITSPVDLVRGASTSPAPDRIAESEMRRLAEQVRVLSSDRERLTARLAALEQSLQEVTGSIARRAPAASPSAQTQRAPPAGDDTATAPSATRPQPAPQAGWAASLAQPGLSTEQPDWPLPRGAAPPAQGEETSAATTATTPSVTRTEFGVDIGGAATISGLRALWLSIRAAQPALFEGLRPVVMVRDAPGGAAELRLIAGPLVNAGTAARLCSSLASTGLTCQPAVFEGQRLALR